MKLEIIKGDITVLSVDAIVNAANSSLLGGGGVDGAIHRAAGPELLKECKLIRKDYPAGLPVGHAVITKGYHLPAKYVIHTVGPVYSEEEHPELLLADCYRNCLELAEKNNLSSIAFPAISTGIFGYPKSEALKVVKGVLDSFSYNSIQKVILCYFSVEDKALAEKVFK